MCNTYNEYKLYYVKRGSMEDVIIVHGRIMERHPDISPDDVAHAWGSRIATGFREKDHLDHSVVVGFDAHGRMLEMVGTRTKEGPVLVFHAMTPPTHKTLEEVRLV